VRREAKVSMWGHLPLENEVEELVSISPQLIEIALRRSPRKQYEIQPKLQ